MSKSLLEIRRSFHQFVNSGTLHNNMLDLSRTNNRHFVKNVLLHDPIGSSDRSAIQFALDLRAPRENNAIRVRNFKKANFGKLTSLDCSIA